MNENGISKENKTPMEHEELTGRIIEACVNVHKALGPGFLESIYREALMVEFEHMGLAYEVEKQVVVTYRGKVVGRHKIDLLVAAEIVLELKAVEQISKKYYGQVRSYLNALGKQVGLLVNFADFKVDVRRVEARLRKPGEIIK